MLPQSLTLILILLLVICCFSAELPGNAYLPPSLPIAADESLLASLNGFLFADSQDSDSDSLARYAPIFVDYPGVHQLLRQQQEYALDLPFEGGHPRRESQLELDLDALAKRSW